MNNLNQLIQQAQKMQGHVKQVQLQLENKRVEASSGGGMVRVVANGKQEILEIKIDPEVVNPKDIEMLEELVGAAVNRALEKSRDMAGEEMSKITGGIPLPGFITNMLGG
jgi:nucleoid-associated protein EbfC